MRQEEVCREQVGPDWAAPVGGMWMISILLLSSIRRQQLSKSLLVCVHSLCEHTCVFFYAWQLRVGVLPKGEKQLLHSY